MDQLEQVRKRADAAVNWGRWISRCVTSWCTDAWGPDLGEQFWQCPSCGLVNEVAWPADPIAVEALLLMRPDPKTRNWEPHETLEDLVMENGAHGILPPGLLEVGGDVALIIDGRIVGGMVYGPVEEWRNVRVAGALAAPRLEIGA
jgi:hypothetical protein